MYKQFMDLTDGSVLMFRKWSGMKNGSITIFTHAHIFACVFVYMELGSCSLSNIHTFHGSLRL